MYSQLQLNIDPFPSFLEAKQMTPSNMSFFTNYLKMCVHLIVYVKNKNDE